MLISELRKWHWLITWDNPAPADSSAILTALGALGTLTEVKTKTTYLLAPKSTIGWRQIRKAIVNNLDGNKGNAVYANLRTGGIFECQAPKFVWKRAN